MGPLPEATGLLATAPLEEGNGVTDSRGLPILADAGLSTGRHAASRSEGSGRPLAGYQG
jgi:hypothetical protein